MPYQSLGGQGAVLLPVVSDVVGLFHVVEEGLGGAVIFSVLQSFRKTRLKGRYCSRASPHLP